MKVLLIRHATAEDQEAFAETGKSDDERPLTDEGKDEMREAARGLSASIKRIDLIAASPLVRAVQTADIVAKRFPDARRELVDVMKPGAAFADFAAWASSHQALKLIAAVGHNPHISELACWLMGAPQSALDMKKGSALLLEFDGDVVEGAGLLRWFMTAKQLGRLED